MPSLSLHDAVRAEADRNIQAAVQAHGHAATGVAIDAVPASIGEYLRTSNGDRAAFDTFTRWADAAIAPRLARTPRTP